jgi:hypothetical protein
MALGVGAPGPLGDREDLLLQALDLVGERQLDELGVELHGRPSGALVMRIRSLDIPSSASIG